jgi:hypothetical protein
VNVAVTPRDSDIVTEHVRAVPLHAPPQPEKVWPAAGVANKLTTLFFSKATAQLVPQSTPAGVLLIAPEPVLMIVRSTLLAFVASRFLKETLIVQSALILPVV